MNDRIKLAEAMYPELWVSEKWLSKKQPDGRRGLNIRALPDPENDANDDYAVLEWMRENHRVELRRACNALGQSYQWNYKIGNNARAALKVLK